MRRIFLLVLLVASSARADLCPPSPQDWTAWTWMNGEETWDRLFAETWCGRYDPNTGAWSVPDSDRRDGIILHVNTAMPYDDDFNNWWSRFGAEVQTCDPNSWGTRYYNGMWFMDYLGDVRQNPPIPHQLTPVYVYDGVPVLHWLVEFAGIAEDDDIRAVCLYDEDAPGLADGITLASNRDGADTSVYYPWFWNVTLVDRAATIAHEAQHEYRGHLDESECTAHASCDDSFNNPEANAQTVHIFFLAQAIDAFAVNEEGEHEIVRYADDTCGYLPLLPEAIRESTRAKIEQKLLHHFRDVPPPTAWPAAARTVTTKIAAYTPGTYNELDVAIGSRWDCRYPCDPLQYDYNAFGVFACDEHLRALNVQVNANNRAACQGILNQVDQGVTPVQLKLLGQQMTQAREPCVPGVDDEVVDAHCDMLINNAANVTDIAANWGIADQGYFFDAQAAITACQQRFCQAQPYGVWEQDAANACYEWDDATGCLAFACGDLAAAGPRVELDYLKAVACRADVLAEGFTDAFTDQTACAEQYADCVLARRHLGDWLTYVAGGDCWHQPDDLSVFSGPAIKDLGTQDYNTFINGSGGVTPLSDACLVQHAACNAQQGLVFRFIGLRAMDEIREGEPNWKPDLPDVYESRVQRYTRQVFEEVADLADAYPRLENTPLQSPRVHALMAPDARVALARGIGHDTWFRMMGTQGVDGVFAPRRITAFARGGERDPYAPDVSAYADRINRLEALRLQAEQLVAGAPPEAFGRANAARIYDGLMAIADARDEDQLDRALTALSGALNAN
ncbi:MAG: hypothetical protein KC620_17530 [Myxococcales bacterium]|nr:hypothetical protein [Myxococcales bacterium]